MVHHALLNNIDHKDVRIITKRAKEYGDNVRYTLTFPGEFRNLQAHYPIFFQKDGATGEFQPLAIFGFEDNENLFLTTNGWDSSYIPLVLDKDPFLIGFQSPSQSPHDEKNTRIFINMDSPRVNREEGESIFLPHGGMSEYLQQISKKLGALHQGIQLNKPFTEALVALDLLETFVVDIELDNHKQHRLMGFYTIHEEKLGALEGDNLQMLNERGYLQAVYMAIASLSNIRKLIGRKNALLKSANDTPS